MTYSNEYYLENDVLHKLLLIVAEKIEMPRLFKSNPLIESSPL